MSLSQGLVRGRSHIAIIVGLLTAAGIILSLENSTLTAEPPLRLAIVAADRREAATLAWNAARPGDPTIRALAGRLGVDTAAAPLPAVMSAGAGRAILASLAQADAAIPAGPR